MILTNEVDCSYRPGADSIFLPTGERTFWSDPADPSPTSAVCWNAGVLCTGGPGTYDECRSANKDTNGNVGVSDDDAVLVPVDRLIARLRAFASQGSREVVVSAIAGVPDGYHDGASDIIHADPQDPQVHHDFGIGPGCEEPDAFMALPPVRVREFAEAFSEERNLFSICARDYGPAFETVLTKLARQR